MLSVLSNRLGLSSNTLPPTSITLEAPTSPPLPSLSFLQPSIPSFSFSTDAPSDSEEEEEEEEEEAREKVDKINLIAPSAPMGELGKRARVKIEPGYSQLDWARLKSSGADLRGGVQQMLRVTPTMLKEHKSRDDCWQVYNGKVYNVTPYLKYHPGGVGETMRAAGKDGTELFMKTHAWINVDSMLEGCMVGYLIREE